MRSDNNPASGQGRHETAADPPQVRSFAELSDTGVLWLINRVVFHPRGFALMLHVKDGVPAGWRIQGDGTEPWSFAATSDDRKFAAVEQLLDAHRGPIADRPKGDHKIMNFDDRPDGA